MELKIISPEGMFYEGEANFVEFTSVEGRMGVYPNHIPLTTVLEPCVVRVHKDDDIKQVEITGGFIEIHKAQVTIMAEGAKWKE